MGKLRNIFFILIFSINTQSVFSMEKEGLLIPPNYVDDIEYLSSIDEILSNKYKMLFCTEYIINTLLYAMSHDDIGINLYEKYKYFYGIANFAKEKCAKIYPDTLKSDEMTEFKRRISQKYEEYESKYGYYIGLKEGVAPVFEVALDMWIANNTGAK